MSVSWRGRRVRSRSTGCDGPRTHSGDPCPALPRDSAPAQGRAASGAREGSGGAPTPLAGSRDARGSPRTPQDRRRVGQDSRPCRGAWHGRGGRRREEPHRPRPSAPVLRRRVARLVAAPALGVPCRPPQAPQPREWWRRGRPAPRPAAALVGPRGRRAGAASGVRAPARRTARRGRGPGGTSPSPSPAPDAAQPVSAAPGLERRLSSAPRLAPAPASSPRRPPDRVPGSRSSQPPPEPRLPSEERAGRDTQRGSGAGVGPERGARQG